MRLPKSAEFSQIPPEIREPLRFFEMAVDLSYHFPNRGVA
jgi:hypothetical protein